MIPHPLTFSHITSMCIEATERNPMVIRPANHPRVVIFPAPPHHTFLYSPPVVHPFRMSGVMASANVNIVGAAVGREGEASSNVTPPSL